jgi:hypothetical protein
MPRGDADVAVVVDRKLGRAERAVLLAERRRVFVHVLDRDVRVRRVVVDGDVAGLVGAQFADRERIARLRLGIRRRLDLAQRLLQEQFVGLDVDVPGLFVLRLDRRADQHRAIDVGESRPVQRVLAVEIKRGGLAADLDAVEVPLDRVDVGVQVHAAEGADLGQGVHDVQEVDVLLADLVLPELQVQRAGLLVLVQREEAGLGGRVLQELRHRLLFLFRGLVLGGLGRKGGKRQQQQCRKRAGQEGRN